METLLETLQAQELPRRHAEYAASRLHHYDTRTQLVLILAGLVPKPDRWVNTRQYTQRCLSEN